MSHEQDVISLPADGAGFDRQEPKALLIGLLALASVVVLVLVFVVVQIYYQHSRDQQIEEKVLAPVGEDLTGLRAREDSSLHSYGYIDKGKGQIRVPIERAMDLIVKEYAEGKVQYSTKPTPVKPPEPVGGQPAPGTTGAPAPSTPHAVGKAK